MKEGSKYQHNFRYGRHIMTQNVLILSPHTDDAELGAGGTIIRLIEKKENILWVVFSTAEESLPKELPVTTLKFEFLKVIKSLELTKENYTLHNFRVRHLFEKRQEILEELVEIRKNFRPNLVIGPSLNDFHQDHRVVAEEMIRAFKTNASIICYELPWNHITFNTQLFVKLEKRHIEQKAKILQVYQSQIKKKRKYLLKDFIFGLASVRGIQIGTDYAEAFEVKRWIL